ncbi:MAG: hypothetical protein VW985_05240 [Gammaproteobacteria bacterium]
MSTHFYMSRQRWIATLVLALSISLIWWALSVRLGSAEAMEQQRMNQLSLEFNINTLRGQRDALNATELVETRNRVRERLLADPDGLPQLVDELLGLAAAEGIDLAVTVGDMRLDQAVEGISMRDLKLRFAGISYDALVAYLQALEVQSDQRVWMIRDVDVSSRGGDVQVNGWIQLRVWTSAAGVIDNQDSLF